jgi:hypothetical protein
VKKSRLQYRAELADYSAMAPLCVVDHTNQIVLAAIMGASTVIRGIIAALRDNKPLVWQTTGERNVGSSRPFLATYGGVQDGGHDHRVALVITDTSKINVIDPDKEESARPYHLTYAFGCRPEEIAWDIMSSLDIPLLPDWSGCFVRAMRQKGWLKPIQSVGLDYAWAFSATRAEYLKEVAGRLGTEFRAPSKNRGWVVRSLHERIVDSLANTSQPIIRVSKEMKVSAAADQLLAEANQLPEQLLMLHREGRSDEGGPLKSKSPAGLSLTTFHRVKDVDLMVQTQWTDWWSETEVRLVQEVGTSVAD